ncbi:MAG: hypothetical protein IJ942_00780 [Alistipes sp.]|nr:hypothetical protein [Alistipes sp.]
MKKIIVIILASIGIFINANAESYGSCKVAGGNGATVAVTVMDFDTEGNVSIQISSDCDDYVNVTFTLELISEERSKLASRTEVLSVQPNSNTQKNYYIPFNTFSNKVDHVNVIVTGARCE